MTRVTILWYTVEGADQHVRAHGEIVESPNPDRVGAFIDVVGGELPDDNELLVEAFDREDDDRRSGDADDVLLARLR